MSRSKRGEHRSIHTVLIDGPDYQLLDPDARLVLLTANLSCGPTGIEVMPAGVAPTFLPRTGLSAKRFAAALDQLVTSGWVQWERNIFWVVRRLEFEPALSILNPKHVSGVQSHVDGLPRLPIVQSFVSHYSPWFEGCDSLSIALPMAMDRSSKQGIRERDKGKGLGKREEENHANAFEAAWDAYPTRPNNSKASARAAWDKSIRAGADPAALLAGVRAYAAFVERENTPATFIKMAATFFGPGRHWESDYGPPPKRMVDMYASEDRADPSPEAAAAMRGAA